VLEHVGKQAEELARLEVTGRVVTDEDRADHTFETPCRADS
jgi:hypothetical protein